MHLPLPFLSQSSPTKRQTYPRYFHQKNVQTWTVLSFGLLILRVRNSQTLTIDDIDDAHSPNKGKRNRKQKEEKREGNYEEENKQTYCCKNDASSSTVTIN